MSVKLIDYFEELLASVRVDRYSSRFPGGSTEVFKNPSPKDLDRIASWTRGDSDIKGFRGSFDGDENLYVWDFNCTHDMTDKALRKIGKNINKMQGNFHATYIDGALLVDSDGESGDFIGDTINRARNLAISNSKLKSLVSKIGLELKAGS